MSEKLVVEEERRRKEAGMRRPTGIERTTAEYLY